jgi:hypothetical protein
MSLEGTTSTPSNTDPAAAHFAAGDDPNQVDTAADVHKVLEDGGVFEDDVTHDELQRITEGLGTLDARQANEVISQLSPEDLAKISDEMKSGGLGSFDGLDANQRKEFIGDLSSKLDATQFQRVAQAYGNPTEVADTVANRGTNDAKLGFIRAHADAAAKDVPGGGPNADAGGVATVLASMDKDGLQRALVGSPGEAPALSSEQLQKVMEPSVNQAGGRAPVSVVNASRLEKVIDAATKNGSTEVKSLVFQKAAGGLADIQKMSGIGAGSQATKVGDRMAALLRSDSNGIVDNLETSDPGGTALKDFARQQISDGKTDGLRDMLKGLRNGPNGDPAAHLADPKNASDLGYAIGAIGAGVEDLKKSAEDNADLLSGLLGSFVGEVPIAGSALSYVSEEAAKAAVGEVKGETKSLPVALYDAMLADVPTEQQGLIDATMGRVLDLQQIDR